MIDWYKCFGGGTSGVHVALITSVFDKKVSPKRVVSGSFFKALSKLKFASNETLPTYLVNAMLMVHAASKDLVRERTSLGS